MMAELLVFLVATLLLAGAGIRLGMLVGRRLSAALDQDDEDASDTPS
jgi:hypothetical protein